MKHSEQLYQDVRIIAREATDGVDAYLADRKESMRLLICELARLLAEATK